MYGTSLRLPGEFLAQQDVADSDPASYAARLKDYMRTLRCTPSRRPSQSTRCTSNALDSASHVFVRHDAVRKPYDGPFPVLTRSDRFYTLDLKDFTNSVSIDRLKPAYVEFPTGDIPSLTSSPATTSTPPSQPAQPVSLDITRGPSATRTTRCGRHVHWPSHVRDFAP